MTKGRSATAMLEQVAKLSRDPHRLREERENMFEVAIGREVRAFRCQEAITVAESSGRTGLSIGMLSKIENGNTSPSLTTLQTLAHALRVPLTSFFCRFEEHREAVLTRAGEGVEIELQAHGLDISIICRVISGPMPVA